ncbi:MAG: hypothetical protein K1X75_15180 [Leptospirales bacterium]|nr:hypothetical protein [Leptospirales bacterium]
METKAKKAKKAAQEEEQEFQSFSAQGGLRSFTEGLERVQLERYQPLFKRNAKESDLEKKSH